MMENTFPSHYLFLSFISPHIHAKNLACEDLCLLRHWCTFGNYSHSKTCQIILSFFSSPCLLRVPLSLPVDGDVKYLNTLCCLGTMHSSRWAGAVRGRCMQISIQSRPGCFQSSSSASGPVLIPLYPRPCRFFIKSNALSAMSTWTSGLTMQLGEKKNKTKKRERKACIICVCKWVRETEKREYCWAELFGVGFSGMTRSRHRRDWICGAVCACMWMCGSLDVGVHGAACSDAAVHTDQLCFRSCS